MKRSRLRGIAAFLNVISGEFDEPEPEIREAAQLLKLAVAAIHDSAKWSPDERDKIADIHRSAVIVMADSFGYMPEPDS